MAWKWRQKCFFFAASVFPYRCTVPWKEFVKRVIFIKKPLETILFCTVSWNIGSTSSFFASFSTSPPLRSIKLQDKNSINICLVGNSCWLSNIHTFRGLHGQTGPWHEKRSLVWKIPLNTIDESKGPLGNLV